MTNGRWLSLVLLTMTLFGTTPAQAYQLKQDATGTPVRWNGAVDFVVDSQLGARLSEPSALAAIQAAVDALRTAAPQLAVTVAAGKVEGLGFDRSGGENQNEILALSDWPFDDSFIAATIVTLDSRTHRILDADIALNTQHRRFRVRDANAPDASTEDIQNTLTHELGHALGLAHNPELESAVMYPSARPGETQKRTLATDDRDGLIALYGVSPLTPEEAAVGCSTSASGAPDSVLMGFFVSLSFRLGRRRNRPKKTAPPLPFPWRSLITTLCFAPFAAAASDIRAPAALDKAVRVFTAEVKTVRTLPPSPNSRLLFSEVQLTLRGCLKGICPESMTVILPGGRDGDLEQVVMGRALPVPGDVLGVGMTPPAAAPPPALALSGLTTTQTASGVTGTTTTTTTTTRTSLYQLTQPEELQAFASGVARSGLSLRLNDILRPHSPASR